MPIFNFNTQRRPVKLVTIKDKLLFIIGCFLSVDKNRYVKTSESVYKQKLSEVYTDVFGSGIV